MAGPDTPTKEELEAEAEEWETPSQQAIEKRLGKQKDSD
jgi:hypothetical protein